MLTLDSLRREKKAEILRLAGIHGCQNVRVLGSVATGENNLGSDIDFLVDLDRGRGRSTWAACYQTFIIF